MTENTPTPAELKVLRDDLQVVVNAGWATVKADPRQVLALLNAHDALAAILPEAPHDSECALFFQGDDGEPELDPASSCTCWKSKLPADTLAARDARMKATALREFADAVRMPWQVFQGDAGQVIRVGDLLRETADRIEREAQR